MSSSLSNEAVYPRKLRRLYWPFIALTELCHTIYGTVAGSFESEGNRYTIPSFAFAGPDNGGRRIRLGFFALLHGDEPAGAHALERFLNLLVEHPLRAAGYDLVLYPICNPTGYEDGTRANRAGRDLNREFWRGSDQPEVRILEEELRRQKFDGVIALHADDTSAGVYGYSQGRVLNENILAPALRSAAAVLPLNMERIIDGFAAIEGVICDCYRGILAPPPEQQPQPFEIIFETPALAPLDQQRDATVAALDSILATYRRFIAYAQDI